MNVTLYTTHCPRCEVLENKLKQKDIGFNVSEEFDRVVERGYRTAPVLQVGDDFLDFGLAIKWVNSQQ